VSKSQLTQAELAVLFRLLDTGGHYAGSTPEGWTRDVLVRQIRVRLEDAALAQAPAVLAEEEASRLEAWLTAAAAAGRRPWSQVAGDIAAVEFAGGCGFDATILATPGHVAIVGKVPGMDIRQARELTQLLTLAITRAEALEPLPELEPEPTPEELAISRSELKLFGLAGLEESAGAAQERAGIDEQGM